MLPRLTSAHFLSVRAQRARRSAPVRCRPVFGPEERSPMSVGPRMGRSNRERATTFAIGSYARGPKLRQLPKSIPKASTDRPNISFIPHSTIGIKGREHCLPQSTPSQSNLLVRTRSLTCLWATLSLALRDLDLCAAALRSSTARKPAGHRTWHLLKRRCAVAVT